MALKHPILSNDHMAAIKAMDLRGWKKTEKGKDSWKSKNWILGNKGMEENEPESILWSEGEFRNFKLIADWRLTGKPVAKSIPVIQYDGKQVSDKKGFLTRSSILLGCLWYGRPPRLRR